ncbi:MAG: sigma-54-dependent Fis family transcriptional regulator [Bryobacterales bacterium]|nr:sigma-54-dependent Fis family transcriptional regulator [Bryobacterales bacterium]
MNARASLDHAPFQQLIGDSPAMRQVARLVSRMAKSRFPALILGETGTGKEVVARAIHNGEARGPFVVIDCSALVGPLMESELFGYAKGAFTGAHVQKLGLLDAANGGTAFLDEIGELPLDMQQKLLRVLQQKEFRAVGGLSQRSSNFRVIAATNRDLALEVEKGRFRQDLYYRLNVMKLRIPPLRERKEDIPLLVSHFLERYGNGQQLPADTMNALQRYDWPGNVRELEHAVQQMIAMNSGQWISLGDLPTSIGNPVRERNEQRESNTLSPWLPDPGDARQQVLPLAEVEKRAIIQAIGVAKGDRTLAAAMLEIGRTTLYRKLKEYGL